VNRLGAEAVPPLDIMKFLLRKEPPMGAKKERMPSLAKTLC
jgi:hypothetical protein